MTQLLGERSAVLDRNPEHDGNGELLSACPAWLQSRRRSAIERFQKVGFPSTKLEEWRLTNVAPIARSPFKPAEASPELDAAVTAAAARFTFGDDAACELVFVNGRYDARLSRVNALPRGLSVSSLQQALESDAGWIEPYLAHHAAIESNPFVALNTGSFQDGAIIRFTRGSAVELPVHVLHIAAAGDEPIASHPRLLAVLEEGAIGTLVESFVGAAGGSSVYFTNAVTEIVAGPRSHLDHCKLQQEQPGAFHVATMQVKLEREAKFVSHSASLGSKLTRNDLNVVMDGEYADATLNGLVLIGGDQHVDNHTLLDHRFPNCASHELYKHVLDGRATGIFKGKILVRQPAQKTDSKQTSKTLLLTDDATINSQPALEIYADDVKCTHGSTIGPVDEEQVFYLRSRGVGTQAARHLMTYAFAADVTRRIKVEPVRRRLEEFMAAQHGLPQDLRITHLGSHDEAATNL